MVANEGEGSRFNLAIAIALATTLLLVLMLPMAFAAGKDTAYSAYDQSQGAGQITDVRATLGNGEVGDITGLGYVTSNTISTPKVSRLYFRVPGKRRGREFRMTRIVPHSLYGFS